MMQPTEHFRTCHLCEAMCGVVITHQDGTVLTVKGDKQDPFSRGHVCPKAVALKDLQEDPDRLRGPVRRTATGWESISWDEAFESVAHALLTIRKQYGGKAIGVYAGNPTVHNTGAMMFMAPFIHALGARQRFSATSVDQLPAMLAALKMMGHQMLLAIPDLDRTDYFLCIGGNPAASNGSLLSAGNVMGRVRSMQQRGGKLVVVDPRRSETAEKADLHVPIRPGRDALMLASILQTIFVHGWERPGRLLNMLNGWDELKEAVAEFTPEKVTSLTGIPAQVIVEIAHEFSHAPRAVAYGRVGACTQSFGGVTLWLIQALNIVTGNLDREGGAMFTHPAIDLVGLGLEPGGFARFHSRVKGLPEFGGEFPVTTLADEILTPGEGQIRALVTHAGNPVLSAPGGTRMDEALASLDFMVSIDIYINETTRHAHIILPPSGPLEHGHFDLIFNMLAVRNVVRYSPPLLPLPAGQKHDWQILFELIVRLGGQTRSQRLRLRALQRVIERLGMEGVLDLMLRAGPYGTKMKVLTALQDFLAGRVLAEQAGTILKNKVPDIWRGLRSSSLMSSKQQGLSMARLRQAPHGLDLGPLMPALPERLQTRSRCIELAPEIYLQDMQRVRELLDKAEPRSLVMIGRRHLRSNNSWMHNSFRLVKGPDRCTLMIHPQDAAEHGLSEGQRVRVSTASGQVELSAEISDAMMPGVVSMPHGFGHHRLGVQLQVAAAHAGVSINDIIDARSVDPLSGVAVLNGVPVEISALS